MTRKRINSTPEVEEQRIERREQIYRLAIEKFRNANPKYDAVSVVSGRMGMGVKMLYAVLNGDRQITVVMQDMLFRECDFPEGYDLLREINFMR